jgi:thiol-disulfide isomerase/thioredoxin
MSDRPTESDPDGLPVPRLRRGLLAAAGLAAAGVGLGLGWWQSQGKVTPQSQPVDGFWSLQWDTPQGAALRAEIFRGKPMLINFWATWCPPCVEELPLINDFYLKNRANGWQVLALAVDKPSAVNAFLGRMPLDFPVGMAGLSGTELGRSLGNLTGALPFTVVIGSDGAVAYRKLGRVSVEDLQGWAALK